MGIRTTADGWDAEISPTTRGPGGAWACLWVTEPEEADRPCRFHFHAGWPEVAVRAVYRLAEIVGPFAFLDDSDGLPLLIDPARGLRDALARWNERDPNL